MRVSSGTVSRRAAPVLFLVVGGLAAVAEAVTSLPDYWAIGAIYAVMAALFLCDHFIYDYQLIEKMF